MVLTVRTATPVTTASTVRLALPVRLARMAALSGPQGPQGPAGTPGQDGKAGKDAAPLAQHTICVVVNGGGNNPKLALDAACNSVTDKLVIYTPVT